MPTKKHLDHHSRIISMGIDMVMQGLFSGLIDLYSVKGGMKEKKGTSMIRNVK